MKMEEFKSILTLEIQYKMVQKAQREKGIKRERGEIFEKVEKPVTILI